jgi:F420-non-reducing hydrogenase iron-sulfur subunit
MKEFNPRITGFLCNWCAYAGADLAGVSRIQYAPNLRVIKVMCSGRVDPVFVFRAFLKGADGVMVLGCHPGDCHYQTGNYQEEKKMAMTRQVLAEIGIIPERMTFDYVSAAEGGRFAEIVNTFTNHIRELGPLGAKEGFLADELRSRLELATQVVNDERIRWLVGKEYELIESGNVYGEKLSKDSVEEMLVKNIVDQFHKERILRAIKDEPLPCKAIAAGLGLSARTTFGYLTYLADQGQVCIADVIEHAPRYLNIRSGDGGK